MKKTDYAELIRDHRPDAIAERLNQAPKSQNLSDAILGGIDGCVTTFAIVSGAFGAGFAASVALVLGFANLFADGFSMAVSNYEAINAQREFTEKIRHQEATHIDTIPEGEREEIKQIFEKKGFSGGTLTEVVNTICQNRALWIETMMTEEHGLQSHATNPLRAACTTFAAFIIVGAMPLLPFLLPTLAMKSQFVLSAFIAAGMFFLIGVSKGFFLSKNLIRSGLGTLATGGAAAAIAFVTGYVLRELFDVTL